MRPFFNYYLKLRPWKILPYLAGNLPKVSEEAIFPAWCVPGGKALPAAPPGVVAESELTCILRSASETRAPWVGFPLPNPRVLSKSG